jgi:predicted nuclease of predicted toxin-antitoxin system
MTFFFDHDVPEDAAFALEALGHQVVRLRQILPTTTTDDEVFRYANDNNHILITCNRDDFLSLIGDSPFSGLIVLVRRPRRALERAALVQLIERVGDEGLRGAVDFA